MKIWWFGFVWITIGLINGCDTPSTVPQQDKIFIKLFGGNGSEEGKDLVVLPDGGFALVGSSTSDTPTSAGGKDVYVVRTDNLGNILWDYRAGAEGDDVGKSIILGSNNNSLYVCGEITQEGSAFVGLRDVIVLNLSLDGALIGEYYYGDSLRDEVGTDIIELGSGGFFISATMNHPDTSKYFLIETTSNLEPIPNRSRYVGTEGVNNYSTKSFENPIDPANPFVCFGTAQRTDNAVTSYWFHTFTYKSNSDNPGIVEHYGTEDIDEYCTDVVKTLNGGYALCGLTGASGVMNEMFVRISPNLQEVNIQTYPNDFNRDVQDCGIFKTSDGGFVISSTIELPDPENDEISLLRLNSEGEELWRKTYGSNEDDTGTNVVELADGSFVIIGTIGFDINPDSKSKMCLMKINPNGDLIPL